MAKMKVLHKTVRVLSRAAWRKGIFSLALALLVSHQSYAAALCFCDSITQPQAKSAGTIHHCGHDMQFGMLDNEERDSPVSFNASTNAATGHQDHNRISCCNLMPQAIGVASFGDQMPTAMATTHQIESGSRAAFVGKRLGDFHGPPGNRPLYLSFSCFLI